MKAQALFIICLALFSFQCSTDGRQPAVSTSRARISETVRVTEVFVTEPKPEEEMQSARERLGAAL